MRSLFAFRSALVLLATAGAAASLSAQMQLLARLNDEMLPVVSSTGKHLNVRKNGRLQPTYDLNYRIRPSSEFGPGQVEIRGIQADLDPLRSASAKERTSPGAIRFRYKATLIADRAVANCYALLTFTAQGSVGTHLIPVDSLAAGKGVEVKVELRSAVDAVGSLHVFADGLELRSSQHPTNYDVAAHLASLSAKDNSLAAAELVLLEEVYPHVLSADGRFLALLRRREAKQVLIAYDLDQMKLLSETPVAEADDFVSGLTWVSDHEVAYVAEEDFHDASGEYKLHLVDTRTGQAKLLLKDVYGIVMAPESTRDELVLLGGKNGISTFRYNVRSRKVSDLQEPANGFYLFDAQGNARVHLRYEGDASIFAVRPTSAARWSRLDDSVRQPGLRFNLRAPELLDRVVEVHSLGPEGDTLYVSSRLDSDRFQLAAFSLSEGLVKQTVASHPRYDLGAGDGIQSRLLFAKGTPRLLGYAFEAERPQVVWLDERFAAVQRAMDVTFPHHANLPIDWSQDGGTFIYLSTSDQDPGTYYVFRPLESRLIPLLQLGERLKGKALARTTAFEFAARDGHKIPAYLTRPAVPGSGPAPLLVHVHGGPMTRDTWRFDATNQFFASRGYAVLQVNYRGSSGYGAAFQNAGLKARLDTVVLDDLADGVRHVLAQGGIDRERVAIMGGSFGGWATYLSLIKYPDVYRAGVAISAIASWRKSLRDDRMLFSNKMAYTFWRSLLNQQDFAASERFIDPLTRAAELKQPILIMHGEADTVVNAAEARLMLDALKKHNPNVQARSFPNATHASWSAGDRVARLNEAAAFLEKHLGRAAPVKP